ncbi:hypothetical protein [Caenimonas soli]|uniref:hypothetical protein n=1 Tax=Caenimonas soli TaxID=2735555 RepID=UPI0015581037|nr:hypothetical protein [Caenimonas soli]NPC57277.1 hypothetical protein [Caenimonas soli]
MNHSIAPGAIPAPRGLEKEEPEFANEEDIPSDDDRVGTSGEAATDGRPLRDVERE